nr:TPA_asm: m103.5 sORF 1 [Murid betaherpesvirus 1]DBA07875.1 TPA_asm: m103.5 sORF 1 [Murid betaherpesvirus 1]
MTFANSLSDRNKYSSGMASNMGNSMTAVRNGSSTRSIV